MLSLSHPASLFSRYWHGLPWWAVTIAPIVTLALAFLNSRRKARSLAPLPPGPKPHWLLGNLLDFPIAQPWMVYHEWAKTYGDVIYLEALGQPMVILNSQEAINELLVTRSSNYSNRGYSPVIELTGFSWAFALVSSGTQRWKDDRRTFSHSLSPTQVVRFHPIIEEELSTFLLGLLSKPKEFRNHTNYLFGSIVMRVSYGQEDAEYNKKLVDLAGSLARDLMEYTTPGRLIVGAFHSLRFIPSWFPGAGWKRALEAMAATNIKLTTIPFNDTKNRIHQGKPSAYANVATDLIEKLPEEGHPDYPRLEEVAKYVSAVSYLAGADTTINSCYGLALALAMYPEIQKKAQAEIDSVIGYGRLPTLADKGRLPYLQAVIKEVHRWHNVLPLSLPHMSDKEDLYKGYRIPANSVIFPNTWSVMHDPAKFEDPMEFKPERYLGKDGKIDPTILSPEAGAFGYGRRICPGRFLSHDIVTLFGASILSCFDVRPGLDEDGKPKELKLEFVPVGLTAAPLPFDCDFIPRSKEHISLLQASGKGF